MYKILLTLSVAVTCCSSAARPASAEDSEQNTVYFYTQIDQRTADYINGYWGINYVDPDALYYAYYEPATGRNGGRKGGGQKVRFGVIVGYFSTGIFGEGNLDSTGFWIDAGKTWFRDDDIGFRLRGNLSLPVLPPPE